jgi:hypothetical protein
MTRDDGDAMGGVDLVYELYGPMLDVLRQAFGVEFDYWNTGGGCTALVGDFEADTAVYLTDAPGSPNGHECQITDSPTRQRVGESTVGFAVGVYRDEHRTNVTYAEYPTAATRALPVIVAEQLKAATVSGKGHAPREKGETTHE